MSLDYLERLDNHLADGGSYYACPGPNTPEWSLGESLAEMRREAQRSANVRRIPVQLFRLVTPAEITPDAPEGSFLVVRETLEPGPRGEPNFRWGIVGSEQAAELVRDVSGGPAPYFGAVVEETIAPEP